MLNRGQCALAELFRRTEEGDTAFFEQQHLHYVRDIARHNDRIPLRILLRAVAGTVPIANLAMHFHDTYGQALANLYAGMEEGARVIDSAAGGLGGCPFAPGATGNVATEEVVYMLEGMGIATGVDLTRLVAATNVVSRLIGRPPVSRVASALNAKARAASGS